MSSGRSQSHIPTPPTFLIEVVASGGGASIMGVIVVVTSGGTSTNSLLSRNGGNAGLFLTLFTSVGPRAFTLMIDGFLFTTAFDLFILIRLVKSFATSPGKRSGESSAADNLWRAERRSDDSEDEGGVATFFLLDGGMDDTDGDGDWCALPMFDLVAATVD